MAGRGEEPRASETLINRRIADMLAANLDEPRYDALLVFHMPSGGKVAALLFGENREDVAAIHRRLEQLGQGKRCGDPGGKDSPPAAD